MWFQWWLLRSVHDSSDSNISKNDVIKSKIQNVMKRDSQYVFICFNSFFFWHFIFQKQHFHTKRGTHRPWLLFCFFLYGYSRSYRILVVPVLGLSVIPRCGEWEAGMVRFPAACTGWWMSLRAWSTLWILPSRSPECTGQEQDLLHSILGICQRCSQTCPRVCRVHLSLRHKMLTLL